MDTALTIPGVGNNWTMPIIGRIDMLSTGIRTPLGLKIFGPKLDEIERIGLDLERTLREVPGTRASMQNGRIRGISSISTSTATRSRATVCGSRTCRK